jgi:hypothetical protein
VGSWSSPLSCGVFLPLQFLQAFSLLIAGRVLLLLSARVFIYSSRGKWVFPPLLWSFPPSATLTSFPAPGCWARPRSCWSLSDQARLVNLQFRERFPSPFFIAQGAPPSLPRVFVVLIAYYSVSLFSPSGDWSFQVAMLIWPRDVCGSTAYHLAHLVCIFPSHLSAGDWQPRGPPGFSVQREVEMLCAWWRCGGVKVLPLLSGLACKVCFQHLSKISL